MSKSDIFENDFLKLILNGTSIGGIADNTATSPLANLYLSLHTADPGEAGNQSTSEIAYTGYARAAVARSASGWTVAASGGSANLTAAISFPAGTGGSGTAAFFGLGTASTGTGKLLYSGVIGTFVGAFTGAVSGNAITIPASGLAVNDRVVFYSTQGFTLPGGLSSGTLYYVVSASGDTITVSATQGGSAVTITASGGGLAFKDVGVVTGNGITPALSTGTTITED